MFSKPLILILQKPNTLAITSGMGVVPPDPLLHRSTTGFSPHHQKILDDPPQQAERIGLQQVTV